MDEGKSVTTEGAGKMKAGAGLILACLPLLLVLGSTANATTADGALLTNTASASYETTASIPAIGFKPTFLVTYLATAPVLISNPVIMIQKVPNTSAQAPGGSVTFSLYVFNNSITGSSAFNVTLTDRMPDLTTYANVWGNWPNGTGVWTAFNSPNNANPWGAGMPPSGQGSPFYLRWVLTLLGPQKSALITYVVAVL